MWTDKRRLENVIQLLGISPIETGVTFLSLTFAVQLLIDLYAHGSYQHRLLDPLDAHQFTCFCDVRRKDLEVYIKRILCMVKVLLVILWFYHIDTLGRALFHGTNADGNLPQLVKLLWSLLHCQEYEMILKSCWVLLAYSMILEWSLVNSKSFCKSFPDWTTKITYYILWCALIC